MWQDETVEMVKNHERNIVKLQQQIDEISERANALTWEEFEFRIRNLENSLANERFFVSKLKEQLKCTHRWECLGGGGQVMTDVCRKCGASYDY